MKTKRIFLAILIATTICCCTKDDAPLSPEPDPVQRSHPEPENQPPGTFDLLSPMSEADREVLSPTFAWETASDPDGDTVTYDLYVGAETDPKTILASSIADTTFMPRAKLELFATYFWKVVARDSKGAKNPSAIEKFETKPLLFAVEYELDGKIVQIKYSAPGIIEMISEERSEENIIFYNDEGKLSKKINRFENIDYLYDTRGRLSGLKRFEPISGDESFTKIDYIELDRIQRIEKRFVGSDFISEISISYREGEALPLGLIYSRANDNGNGNYDILYQARYFFIWDGRENLVEILVEVDNQLGDGFQFASLTKLTYDTMQNPAYDILKDGFGFQNFFIEYSDDYKLKSLFLSDGLGWVSENNLLTVERKYKTSNQSIIYEFRAENTYEYNSAGYPKTSLKKTVFENGIPKFYEGRWQYD